MRQERKDEALPSYGQPRGQQYFARHQRFNMETIISVLRPTIDSGLKRQRQPAIFVITRATSELSNSDQGHTFTVMGLVFFISRIASFTLVSRAHHSGLGQRLSTDGHQLLLQHAREPRPSCALAQLRNLNQGFLISNLLSNKTRHPNNDPRDDIVGINVSSFLSPEPPPLTSSVTSAFPASSRRQW
jgi:hypothetical protein